MQNLTYTDLKNASYLLNPLFFVKYILWDNEQISKTNMMNLYL